MSLLNLPLSNIPHGSVLGLNYSGMHDTAVAIVSPDGTPLYAVALERLSRVKQDGRAPVEWIKQIPWDRISRVAIPTDACFVEPKEQKSVLHPIALKTPHTIDVLHDQKFYDFVATIPCEIEYVNHRVSHVASAFWGSEFDEALCLNYDGGMSNDPWFGGLFKASRTGGIHPLDQFNARNYAKITLLYQVVTALLGFTASKHEGKVTGLAAYGKATDRCRSAFHRWLQDDFINLEGTLKWIFAHNDDIPARIVPNGSRLQTFCKEVLDFPKEELAATVQEMAELHVIQILENARNVGWTSKNICMSGGLFANVKINQRVAEFGFDGVFVAPPMGDDGAALGAAWDVLSRRSSFKPTPLTSMYLGPAYNRTESLEAVMARGIQYENFSDAASEIASLLAKGFVVAIFQGAGEFGPRALGNRSILASAGNADINNLLNARLNRTEFMPFAPIGRMEDAETCYHHIARVRHAAEFMTVTVECTDRLKALCPAVVHVDGTARPQLVTKLSNPLIYDILTRYQDITALPVLVNTSFNIHEEPIVCTPDDALRGFYESALDYLYIEHVGIIPFAGNEKVAIQYMQEKLRQPSAKLLELTSMNRLLDAELEGANRGLEEKEAVIQGLIEALKQVAPVPAPEPAKKTNVETAGEFKNRCIRAGKKLLNAIRV